MNGVGRAAVAAMEDVMAVCGLSWAPDRAGSPLRITFTLVTRAHRRSYTAMREQTGLSDLTCPTAGYVKPLCREADGTNAIALAYPREQSERDAFERERLRSF